MAMLNNQRVILHLKTTYLVQNDYITLSLCDAMLILILRRKHQESFLKKWTDGFANFLSYIYIYIYCFSKQRIEVARNHPLFLLLACFVIFFFWMLQVDHATDSMNAEVMRWILQSLSLRPGCFGNLGPFPKALINHGSIEVQWINW